VKPSLMLRHFLRDPARDALFNGPAIGQFARPCEAPPTSLSPLGFPISPLSFLIYAPFCRPEGEDGWMGGGRETKLAGSLREGNALRTKNEDRRGSVLSAMIIKRHSGRIWFQDLLSF